MEITELDADTPEEMQILTVGDLLERLKDEHPDTPFALNPGRSLSYIVGASEMWDGDLRVFVVF